MSRLGNKESDLWLRAISRGNRRRWILTVRCRSSGSLPAPISQSQILLALSKIRMYDVCLFFVLRPCLPSACTGFTNYYPCYHAEQIALVLCCTLARRGNNLSVLIECCNRYCTEAQPCPSSGTNVPLQACIGGPSPPHLLSSQSPTLFTCCLIIPTFLQLA